MRDRKAEAPCRRGVLSSKGMGAFSEHAPEPVTDRSLLRGQLKNAWLVVAAPVAVAIIIGAVSAWKPDWAFWATVGLAALVHLSDGPDRVIQSHVQHAGRVLSRPPILSALALLLASAVAGWVYSEHIIEEVATILEPNRRFGAICASGKRSTATGQGACSWNGGVSQWIYGRTVIEEVFPNGHVRWGRTLAQAATVAVGLIVSVAAFGPMYQTRRTTVKPPTRSRATCPRCDSKLVPRTNRTTGGRFVGCSRFPTCRYTR